MRGSKALIAQAVEEAPISLRIEQPEVRSVGLHVRERLAAVAYAAKLPGQDSNLE